MKLCKDCKHIRAFPSSYSAAQAHQHAMCNRPQLLSPVTGTRVPDDSAFCVDQRKPNRWFIDPTDRCGPGAKYWEPKE